MKIQNLRVQTAVWVSVSAFCVTYLTGCGANGTFTKGLGPDTEVQALSGKVHGGPNPVSGATVTLYATTTEASPTSANNYGYGEAGTVLGTTTTDSSGNFAFTGTETACPAGQQAYIVAAGGKTGSNSANSAALLMAALGPCSGITEGSGSGATKVIIDEPTTIAAAYALSGFMTVSGTTVNISAPANNNAASSGCTNNSSHQTTGCKASGLAHAFLNAANLVNSTTGTANSTITTGATITATVPQMLINTLANSVEACINSSGASSTPCTDLLNYPQPAYFNSSLSAPATTLEALLDLAWFPVEAANPNTSYAAGPPPTGIQPAASTMTVFNDAFNNAYYSPALTSAPLDFTIAIDYVFAPGGTVQAPWGISTDINDNVYVYAASTPGTVYSLTSNGAQNWATATRATSDGCGTFGNRCMPVPDTLGNVWVTDTSGLTQMAASGGALGTTYQTVEILDDTTVDIGNNVWGTAYAVTGGAGSQANPSVLEELPQGASAIVDVNVAGAPLTGSTPLKDPTFDTAGNLWAASDSANGGNGVLLIISNNNSLTAPDFSYNTTTNPAIINGGGGAHTNAPLMDISGNMWVGSEDDLNQVASFGSETGGATNYATSMTDMYATTSAVWDGGVHRFETMDGDGKIVVDAASGGFGFVTVYYPNATADALATDAGAASGTNIYLNPCSVQSGTTCTLDGDGGSVIMNASRGSVVDDSGAIWATLSSGKNVIQVLGPGAPSWGQASYKPLIFSTNTSERPY